VNGSAYGKPYFAPMKPELHRMTNRPGAIRANQAASYISGTNLIVDGAATSRIQY
jgi:hypothetical protein